MSLSKGAFLSLFIVYFSLLPISRARLCSTDLTHLSDQAVMALAQTLKLGLCAASLTDFKDENHFDIIIWSKYENGVWAWKSPVGARKLSFQKTAELLREFSAAGVCFAEPTSLTEATSTMKNYRN